MVAKGLLGAPLAGALGAVLFAGAPALAASSVEGTWTGTAYQNEGASGYTVVITITPSEAATRYPELNCTGRLTRAGASGDYVFFSETIVRDESGGGESCIDGTITVARAGDKLAWGWFGSFEGKVYTAWGLLSPR